MANYAKMLFCASFVFLSGIADAQDGVAPEEFVRLKQSYEAEIKRVTEIPKQKYLEALERLLAFYTRSGDLEKALVVREEIKTMSQDPAEAEPATADLKVLDGSEWKWGSGGTLKLERNGDAIHTAWPVPGEWEEVNNVSITIKRPGGDPPMSVVFASPELLEGTVTSHTGATTKITRIVK